VASNYALCIGAVPPETPMEAGQELIK
jgi:hypothetical protein